ncbi:hypothetical protein [Variovorax sp. 770b2]|uniref:hypothetical protein n=1 Tax=Variovorax sp. 770b2 TaxID=1566271 RepID=UPI0011600DF8|nr:hypothetical protein [Variovorax sp. 770b2]
MSDSPGKLSECDRWMSEWRGIYPQAMARDGAACSPILEEQRAVRKKEKIKNRARVDEPSIALPDASSYHYEMNPTPSPSRRPPSDRRTTARSTNGLALVKQSVSTALRYPIGTFRDPTFTPERRCAARVEVFGIRFKVKSKLLIYSPASTCRKPLFLYLHSMRYVSIRSDPSS